MIEEILLGGCVSVHAEVAGMYGIGGVTKSPGVEPGLFALYRNVTMICSSLACGVISPLPFHPAVTSPITPALVLAPAIVLLWSPSPVVWMNGHACLGRIIISLGGMPTNRPNAGDLCRRTRPGEGKEARARYSTDQRFL
jgi:hypothetical protein